MKFTKIALALATLAAAQNASAFDVYLSGASALRSTVADMVARSCQVGSITQFGTGSTRLYKCNLHTDATFAAANPGSGTTATAELGATLVGKPLRLFHSVVPGNTFTNADNIVGGSITGIIPLLPNAASNLVNFCSDVAGNTTCATKFAAAPHLGFSDVEPALFTNFYGNLPTDATAIANGWKLTGTDNPANLTNAVAFIGSFGVAATNSAIAQGLTNVSTDQLAEILSGNIYSTDQLVSTTTPLNIRVCRRAPGSGTQATFNALISRKGCGVNTAAVEFSVADASNPQVTEAAATQGVKDCLVAAQAAGEAGIGILGLENNAIDAANWTYLSVNGVQIFDAAESATPVDGVQDKIHEEKIINGSYPLWVESVVIKSAKVALNAEQNAFYNYIANNAGAPVFTKKYPGVVSLPKDRAAATNNLGGFASNFTRSGNTCNAPAWVF